MTTLIATNPHEMKVAQDSMIEWAHKKMLEAGRTKAELQECIEIAAKNKQRISTLKRHARIAKQRTWFYQKIKAALQAGYYIVPDMPIQLFAIKTVRSKPLKGKWERYSSNISDERPQLLAIEDGEYKSPSQLVVSRTFHKKDSEETYEKYRASDYQLPDLPGVLVRPQLIEEVGRALQNKIFDAIGIAPPYRRSCDPMIIGQLLVPGTSSYSIRRVNFLIAWFLNPETL